MTSPLAGHSGKVWSRKEIGSVFLHTTQANDGKNEFGLAGLASLKIFNTGCCCPSGRCLPGSSLPAELFACSRAGQGEEIKSYISALKMLIYKAG